MQINHPFMDRVLANATKIREIVSSERACNPRVFGSVARGEETSSSDIDILIDKNGNLTMLNLSNIEIELESLLGSPVDVLVSSEIPEIYKAQIYAQALAL